MDGVTDQPVAAQAQDSRKPVLLIYANCQADHLAKVLPRLSLVAEQVTVKYLFIHSLEEPGKGWDSYPEDYMQGVACVWEQISEAFPAMRAELQRRLPPGVRRIRFPALTASMIWPFSGPDPRPSKRQLYLYGDSIAARLGMRLAGKQVTDDEIFEEYMTVSSRRMPDLDRRLELEDWAWRKRDLDSDIAAAEYLHARFRDTQLFYEAGRIARDPLLFLASQLVRETFAGPWSGHAEIQPALEQLLRYHVGYDTISQPVHPLVAERLRLQWYDPEAQYRWFAHDWTFREWIIRCVRFTPYVATLF